MCLIKPFSGAIVLCGTAKWGRAAARAQEHRRGQRDRVPPGPGNPTDGFHYNVSMWKYLESIGAWGQQQPARFGYFTIFGETPFGACVLFFDWLKGHELQNLWVGCAPLDSVNITIDSTIPVYLDCYNTSTTVTPHLQFTGRIMRGTWNFFWLKQSGLWWMGL